MKETSVQMIGNGAYAASPTNTARSRGPRVRDDGSHSRPPRRERSRRAKAAIALVAFVLAAVGVFIVRATDDRDQRVEPACTEIYTAEVCAVLESP